MTVHVTRWLSCDFPGCIAVFDADARRAVMATSTTALTLQSAAACTGWAHTAEGDDLCQLHADVHAGRPPQPALFPVREEDHGG